MQTANKGENMKQLSIAIAIRKVLGLQNETLKEFSEQFKQLTPEDRAELGPLAIECLNKQNDGETYQLAAGTGFSK